MIIDFDGYLEIDSEVVKFINLNDGKQITGTKYLLLPDEEKQFYILDSFIDAIHNCSKIENEMDFLNDQN